MENSVNYYQEKLDNHELTGYLFKFIKIPKMHNSVFMLSTILTFSLAEAIFPSNFLFLFIGALLCWEHYNVMHMRTDILGNCVMEETLLKDSFIENGIDPNFPDDPMYVTPSDRAYIFKSSVAGRKKYKVFTQIKNGYVHLIVIAISSVCIYGITSLICN